jgi:hypothetical protein
MKDFAGNVQYKGREYKLVFNLNVMEAIQEQYGTLDAWGSLTDGEGYAKRAYEQTNPKKAWEDLTAKEKALYPSEPDAKAVIFGFTQMINEGIDIDNEENGTDIKPMTLKQVGRMITEIGLAEATKTLNNTVNESTKGEEKNE